jgi:hypothetical protein
MADEPDPVDRILRIGSVARRTPGRLRDELLTLLEPNGLYANASGLRHFSCFQ